MATAICCTPWRIKASVVCTNHSGATSHTKSQPARTVDWLYCTASSPSLRVQSGSYCEPIQIVNHYSDYEEGIRRSARVVHVNHSKLSSRRGDTVGGQRFCSGDDTGRKRFRAPTTTKLHYVLYCICSKEETYFDVSTSKAIRRPLLDSKLSSPSHLGAHQSTKLKFWIISVDSSEELLAAATLRAQLFYKYPEITSTTNTNGGLQSIKARLPHEFGMRYLMNSRIKAEFERDSKMQELNMKVRCLLAVCEDSIHQQLLLSSPEKRNTLIAPPAVTVSSISSRPLVAIGTLDIQGDQFTVMIAADSGPTVILKDGTGTEATVDVNTVTFQLYSLANAQTDISANRRQISKPGPGHSLLRVPSTEKSQVRHGYIFNLCITETARRQGVATALMREAVQVGRQMQLHILYVHVEADNTSALALYEKLGYIVKEEESPEVERRYQRSRRILLSCYCFQ